MNRFLRALIFTCLAAMAAPVFVTAQSVSFTGNPPLTGCGSVPTFFTPTITGCSGSSSVMWFFRNHATGEIDSSAVSSHTFDSVGSYDVLVRVICDSFVLRDSFLNYITVNPQPAVNFSTTNPAVDTNLICGPHTVTFVNTTIADTSCAHTWTWFVTGPGTSLAITGTTFTRTFTNAGDYSVTLFYFAPSCGCVGTITKNNYIHIDTAATACFTSDGRGSSFCAPPATVNYDASCSRGATGTFEWHFGDHTTSTTSGATTSHTFTSPGSYDDTVYVITAGGCRTRDVISSSVFIGNLTPYMTASDDTVCQGADVTFTDSTYGGASIAFNKFTLTHVSTGTVIDTRYSSPATFSFGYPAPYDAGLYRIDDSVVDAGGCSGVTTRYVWVRIAPHITSLTADSLYRCDTPLRVHFGSSVSPGPSSAYTYRWSFGGSAAATTSGVGLTAPTHSYTALGSYSPGLRITDRFGCSDDTSTSGLISLSPPTFNIVKSVDSGCSPLYTHFVVNLLFPTGLPYAIDSVTFSDSTAPCIGSACADSAHIFTRSGRNSFTVHWRLPSYLGGCTGSDSAFVIVGTDRPDRGIYVSADTICPNTLLVFQDSCTTCTSRNWELPLGYSSDTSSTNILVRDGDADLRYTLYRSVRGCGDTVRGTIRVEGPSAGGVSSSVANCTRPNVVSFRSLDTRMSTRYTWYFEDTLRRSTSTGTSTATDGLISYTFPRVGIYRVYAVVTGPGPRFCTDTTILTYYNYDTVASIAWSIADTTVCVNETVTCNGPLITASDGSTSGYSQYEWSFGDGSSPDPYTTYGTAGATVTHVYTAPGLYTVRLVIINNSGCRVTALSRNVIVRGPTGGFTHTPEPVCVGEAVTFTDRNTDYATSIILPHRWNLDASGTGILRNIYTTSFTYAYSEPGTYMVTLSDSDAAGCTSTYTDFVNVVRPEASFYSVDTVDNLCAGLSIRFHCNQSGFLYSWNFGDGTGFTRPSATAQDTTYTYASPGMYTVSLTITSTGTGGSSSYPSGCSVTVGKPNYINIRPFRYTSTNYGDGESVACPPLRIVRFADVPGGIARDYTTYQWTVISALGTDTYSGPLLNTTLYTSGRITVILTGTTIRGCQDTEVTNYFVGGPSGYITVTPDSGCVPVNVRIAFVDTGTTAASSRYIWYACPFGSFTTVAPDTTLPYTSPGTYCTPLVTIASGSCAVNIRATDSIRVFPIPNVSITPNPVPVLCYNTSTSITAIADEAISSYSWAPATGLSCTTCASPNVGPLVNTTYTVTGTSIHGCPDTAIINIQVDSPLHINITGKARVCQGVCDTLVASGIPGALYAWTGTGISCAVCDTNVICINRTRTFYVTGTNAYGCQTTDSFTVIIDTIPVLHVSPDPAYVCKYSDPTLLTASGADTYVWKPRLGLSCDSCASPYCDIQSNIIYSITGTTQYGCKDSISIPVTVYDTVATGISRDTSICIGQSVQLRAYSGISYLWRPANSLSDPTSSRPIATPNVTTTYTVYITENVCFKDTLQVTVRVVPLPVFTITPDREVIAGTTVQLYIDTPTNVKLTHWMWTPADTTLTCYTCPRPYATPVVTTTYSVTASTDEGCTGYGQVTIRVLCNEDQIFIPNTFTPNGDGVNDRFYISGKGLGNIKRLTVYNRWGELMYEANNVRSNDPGTGWDGTFNGEILPPDVYVYVVDVLCSTGEKFFFKGDVSLVR